jgi:hypothetical protein
VYKCFGYLPHGQHGNCYVTQLLRKIRSFSNYPCSTHKIYMETRKPIKTDSQPEKVKTTILIDRRLKKLAQVHGIQNDKTLSEIVEAGLERVLGVK